MDGLAKVLDVVCNGRAADPEPAKKDNTVLLELIKRRTSTMLVNGKLYRFEVTRVKL